MEGKKRKVNEKLALELKDRDWYINKAIKDNKCWNLLIGGMYTGYLWISILYIILAVFQMPLIAFTVYVCREYPVVIFECVHFVILLMLALVTMVHYLIQRSKLQNIFEALGRGYYDYGDTLDAESLKIVARIKKESAFRVKIIRQIFTAGIIVATTCIIVLRPLIQLFFPGISTTKELPPQVNGAKNTYVWYPWDRDNTVVNTITYIAQDAYTIITANQVVGYNILYYAVSESLTVQLEIMKLSLRRVMERATHITGITTHADNLKTNKEFRAALQKCFKTTIEHHQIIIRIFDDFKSINYLTLLWMVTGSIVLLCMSSMLFMLDEVPVVSKITFSFFLFGEILEIFLNCWYGEKIAQTSADIPWDLYSADWFAYYKEVKVYHSMLTMRCARPLELSGGGFMKINRNTFLDVVKTAYSYNNLFLANGNREDGG